MYFRSEAYMTKLIPSALPHLRREEPCASRCTIIHWTDAALSQRESYSPFLPSHFLSTKSVQRNTSPAKLFRKFWRSKPASFVSGMQWKKNYDLCLILFKWSSLFLSKQTNKQQMPYSHLASVQCYVWGFNSVKVKPFKMMGPVANVTRSQGYRRSVWYCCMWY